MEKDEVIEFHLSKKCCMSCIGSKWNAKDERRWKRGKVRCPNCRIPRPLVAKIGKYDSVNKKNPSDFRWEEKCPYQFEHELANSIQDGEKDADLEVLKLMGLL